MRSISMATETKTNILGYFNPNPYRVNVAISELGGLAVLLNPMEFILERATGRKINDPILDKYVGFKMLSPEVSDKPVPVVLMPRLAPTIHSQYAVTQGVRDAQGKWGLAPANSKSAQTLVETPPTVTKPSHIGMSMEEARRRGLVGKPRLVPDDYGAVETDGAPTRGDAIPRIKYAVESVAPNAKPGTLPRELIEQVNPTVAPLLAGLQAAAQTDPEAVNLGRKAAEAAVAAQQGQEGVQRFRAARKQIKATIPTAVIPPPNAPAPAPAPVAPAAPRAASPVGVVQPRRRVAQVVTAPAVASAIAVPPPPMEELQEVTSPIMGGRTAEQLPPPVLEDGTAPAEAPEPPPTAEDYATGGAIFACNEPGCDGKEFPYRSYYIRHIQRKHKDRLAQLMAQLSPR